MPTKMKMEAKKQSPWIMFVKQHYAEMKKKDPKYTYKNALMSASKVYKK